MLPSVSVVIPTFREQDRLLAALRSLAAQDYPSQAVELIVVDDASPDFDSEQCRAAVGPFALQVIRHATNQGRARARNSGIRAASGELVVFLDSDMTVGTDFLRAHADLHQRPGTVVIGHIRFGPQVQASCFTRYLETRGANRLRLGEPVPFKCFVTGNSSLQREQLLRVGLFDEDFTTYGGEDLELGYRLHLGGAEFRYAPRALSLHHHLRPLEQSCQLMHTYGRHSIPMLLRKHPGLSSLLRLEFLAESLFSPRRLFLHTALLPLVYHPALCFARWSLEWYVPDLCFDYLWWYNRTRGYLEALSQGKRSGALDPS